MKAVEKAYSTIRNGILEGRFAAASRITEQEIAEQSGVSRTPVREALRRLQAEGLLHFVPNQGAVVASWTPEDIEEIFELRSMLESYTAERAAQRVNKKQLARLRDLAQRQYELSQNCSGDLLDQVAELNSEFHQVLQEAAGSNRLNAIVAQLIEVPLVGRTFRRYSPEQLVRSARHHLEIVQALEIRDSEAAGAIMRMHVLAARQVFRTLSESNLDGNGAG